MSQPTPEQLRANEAISILSNPLYKEAFEGVREAIVQAMETDMNPEAGMTEKRIALLQGLPLLREYLENYVQTGRMTDRQAEEI